MYARSNPTSEAFTATPGKYPQGRFNPKPCRTCGTEFTPIAPSHLYCSDECSSRAQMDNYLQRTYGISAAQHDKMYEDQGGVCKLCGSEGFLMQSTHKLKLVVDHCHKGGHVRGLLCHNCNRALGLLKDNTETLNKAIAYLEGATTIPEGSTP